LSVRAYPFAIAGYALAVLLVLSGSLEVAVRALPLAFDRLPWRIAVESAVVTVAPQMLLGLGILAWSGLARDEDLPVRLAALAALGLGVLHVAAVCALLFGLPSALGQADPSGRGVLRNRLVATALVGAAAGVVSFLLAVAAWRAARAEDGVVNRAIRTRDVGRHAPPLIRDLR
jgi:hypothetical protein